MRRSGGGYRLLGLSVVLALVLTACQQGGQQGDDGEEGFDDFNVGLLLTLTGEFGTYGKDAQRAYEIAADELNESGLMPDGSEVRLTAVDEGSTENCVREATKFVQVDNVDVILGGSSNCIVALEQLASSNQVSIISNGAGTVRLDVVGGEWLYRTYASDSGEGVASARFFLDKGAQTAAVIAQNTESTQGIANVFTSTLESAGAQIVAEVTFESGQPSYQTEINEAIGGDPDVVFIASGEEAGRTLMREISQAGYEGDIGVNGDLSSPQFLEDVGADIMEGVCNSQATPDETSESFQAFNSVFKERHGYDAYVTIPNAYDSLIVTALAGIQGGSFDGATINENLVDVTNPPGTEVSSFAEGVEAIESGDEIDYQGPSGVVDFDETGTSKLPFTTLCVQDGEWTPMREFSTEELGE
jgi:branched-chain amino acid transport system substrate-binding protein